MNLMVSQVKELKIWLLRKLLRQNCWGKGHISEDYIARGKSKNMKKIILKLCDNLVRESLLVRFPHGNQKHYYLNPKRREERIECITKAQENF